MTCMRIALSLLAVALICSVGVAEEIEYVNSCLWSGGRDVDAEGDHAFCAFSNGLVVLDVSSPAEPSLVGRVYAKGKGRAIDVSDGYAYIADGFSGLQIIDVTTPSTPIWVAAYDTPHEACDVAVAGSFAYVADGSFGALEIIDISDPTTPTWVAGYEPPYGVYAVSVAGTYAYVLAYGERMHIIDVSDPCHPVYAGDHFTPCAHNLKIVGDYAYVIAAEGGSRETGWLEIIDVSNPEETYLVGTCSIPGWAMSVAISGSFAYVTGGANPSGLYIVDISEPEQPVCRGDVADGSRGFQSIDITLPDAPLLIGGWCEGGMARELHVAGDYLYLADALFGLRILAIADPNAPILLSELTLPNYPQDIAVSGGYAFIAAWEAGLKALPPG